jgi:hypothetical protein
MANTAGKFSLLFSNRVSIAEHHKKKKFKKDFPEA